MALSVGKKVFCGIGSRPQRSSAQSIQNRFIENPNERISVWDIEEAT